MNVSLKYRLVALVALDAANVSGAAAYDISNPLPRLLKTTATQSSADWLQIVHRHDAPKDCMQSLKGPLR